MKKKHPLALSQRKLLRNVTDFLLIGNSLRVADSKKEFPLALSKRKLLRNGAAFLLMGNSLRVADSKKGIPSRALPKKTVTEYFCSFFISIFCCRKKHQKPAAILQAAGSRLSKSPWDASKGRNPSTVIRSRRHARRRGPEFAAACGGNRRMQAQ